MSEIIFTGSDGYETYIIDQEKMIIGIRPKWISVKDSLPESNTCILIYGSFGIYIGMRDHLAGPCFIVAAALRQFAHYVIPPARFIEGVTHWMPLPKSPAEAASEPDS